MAEKGPASHADPARKCGVIASCYSEASSGGALYSRVGLIADDEAVVAVCWRQVLEMGSEIGSSEMPLLQIYRYEL